MSKPRVIYWFRTDLRLHDSPALKAALDLKPEVFFPIWCWDSHYVYRARVGVNRFQFLIDCQNDLSKSITKLNKKSKLFVMREPAVTLLPKLFKQWKVTHLVFEQDTDAYAKDRDQQVTKMAEDAGVEVIVKTGRTLWNPDEIVKANGGKPTMSIAQLQAAGAKLGEIEPSVDTPTSLPPPGDMKLNIEQTQPKSEPDINKKHRDGEEASYSAGIAGPNDDFAPPSLEELGMPAATSPHKGGETVILERLHKILEDEDYCGTFEKPKTSPAAFEPQSTFLTSPYLHFGALSCRYVSPVLTSPENNADIPIQFYHKVQSIIDKRKKANKTISTPPESLAGQLLFRDMYFAAQAALGYAFGQTYNNPNCRFIPWHLPSKIDLTTKLITGSYEVDDPVKETEFKRWSNGTTGFPWIDAIMRQLRQEGWIHHLARHSVACFLTRGGVYISWERGAEVFEELLIDHEAACNIGNWQWLSCTAFYAQFYRCYSPIAFGKKWDPNGDYIRKYCPELKDYPAKHIFEPHKAPISDQKAAGVRIDGDGTDKEHDGLALYPKPMFDFSTQRDICLQGMKNAYHVGLYGNSPKMLDGTWKELFEDDAEGPTEGGKGEPGGLGKGEDGDGDGGGEDGGKEEEVVKTPKREAGGSGSVKKSPRGHKREHSQSTLDFGKKSAKK
ncbi:Cryptochrome-2 [Fulvia fulva]|nr:Cryptochrome-2 [Fulvia fulva]